MYSPVFELSDEWQLWFLRLFWTLSVGVLGSSAIALGNALIFHSLPNMMSLMIHLSPLVNAWCVRWNAEALFKAYPHLLSNPAIRAMIAEEATLSKFVGPAATFYVIWWDKALCSLAFYLNTFL